MKRKNAAELGRGADDEEENQPVLKFADGSDVCKALMDRYAKSSTPQHRHLCASAAAIRSILQEEGLALSPSAYFAAVITAIRDADAADHDAVAALSAFLAILLPLVPTDSLPPPEAKNAALVLATFLEDPNRNLPTGAVRSVVKSLGVLVFTLDFEEWTTVKLLLEVILTFTVDKRPKVRRCAQLCVQKGFATLKSTSIIKKTSKSVLSLYKKYIPLAEEICTLKESGGLDLKELPKTEHLVVIHLLSFLKLVAPYLSEKVRMEILSDVYRFLGSKSFLLTRHITELVDALVEQTEVKVLVAESDKIISALTSYLSSTAKIHLDSIVSGLKSLRNLLNKLHDFQPTIWIGNLPAIFMSVKGYLDVDINTAEVVAEILKDLINVHIDLKLPMATMSQLCNNVDSDSPEANAIVSICSGLNNMLDDCSCPTEPMLGVISVLFLKLGKMSSIFMKDILLKLSQLVREVEASSPTRNHLQECIGSAVIAMGPENLLSLIPISFNGRKLTCSNIWLISILKKYVSGASLHFFMEHIVPLAKSVQQAWEKVKKSTSQRRLRSYACKLWDLLPAFCRYPTDTYQSFDSLTKLLVHVLKEDHSLLETISISLKTLVDQNLSILQANQDVNQDALLDTGMFTNLHDRSRSFPIDYSKKTVSRNIKALTSNSLDLIQTLSYVFIGSPSEKHAVLKEAIESLALLAKSKDLSKLFLSLLEKLDLLNIPTEPKNVSEGADEDADKEHEMKEAASKQETCQEQRCLLAKLASSFVAKADEKLVNLIFNFIKSSLLVSSMSNKAEELFPLSLTPAVLPSIAVQKHSWFCAARVDDLIHLLQGVEKYTDGMVERNRLSCYHFLLVHIININEEESNTKAFLILNEIILALKSKKASRKMAYDILLAISSSLKNCHSENAQSDLQRLFVMVMGYLSSSSPHIVSGAISALSLLIYNDAEFCLAVPNLIPSVLVLLQNKSNEVIKAALGFVKVLVSSLNSNKLINLVPDVLNGILPWSAISRNHFRSKVAVVLEILIRKCGFEAIDNSTPRKYKDFFKSIVEGRQNNKKSKGLEDTEAPSDSKDFDTKRGKKRALDQPEKGLGVSYNVKKGMGKKQSDGDSMNKASKTVAKGEAGNQDNGMEVVLKWGASIEVEKFKIEEYRRHRCSEDMS
ncbi:RRP12-like protein [Canna indica]|uniref:RRP12-like protein n=1 Tax=Canna indica TaxID=4628 RepID=A0AAQ3K4P3_9LILI|nr:RRP12-like protein [Canna indica]